MRALAATCERVAETTKRGEKVRILAEHLWGRPIDEAAVAAVFLSGSPFPACDDATLDVGGMLLWRAVEAAAGVGDAPVEGAGALRAAYRKHGDLGAAAHDVLAASGRAAAGGALSVIDVEARLRAIARARGPAAKLASLGALFAETSPIEAKYVAKIITSDLRIGSKESLVEEAIAAAFSAPVADVQRANMLLGDVGATLRLAAEGRLGDARMRLFHPIGLMLATPAEDAAEAFDRFEGPLVEDKYDGIRAQAHVGGGRARLFSRALDEVTSAFPELVPELAAIEGDAIIDGEILAFRGERALPFAELQKRLGRKKVPAAILREVPVAFVAFDVIYAGGELLLDRPLVERAAILDRLIAGRRAPIVAASRGQQSFMFDAPEIAAPAARVIRAPMREVQSAAEIDALFEAAQARGNEGLMIKDPRSPYTPGRRGRSWLKLKRELATLDVVVTAVEHGHGKRAAVLSDYTFAVRNGERLVNIGKAYTGLTDAEIAELTAWFFAHTVEDRGRVRLVEPTLVIEVAFNAIMESDRHESGYALRFPRIVRIRADKPVTEIDTLDDARRIFERQGATPA